MVKIDYFDIRFDAKNGVFYAGQTVSGTVVLSVQDPLKASAIWMTMSGEARTSWVNKTSDKIFERCEPYVNQRQDIDYLNRISDGELLPVGVHTIPFAFQLPQLLPSSYEGDFGYVRYSVSANVRLSGDAACIMGFQGLKELNSDKSITVLSIVDAAALSSGALGREETFDIVGCCRSKGSLSASLSASTAAFVGGGPMRVQVQIANRTSQKQRQSTLLLMQDTHFESQSRYENVGDSKMLTRVVDSATLDPTEFNKTITKDIVFELAPDLTPSTVNARYIINVSYKLKLDLNNGCEVILPVYIASMNSKQ